MKTKKEKGDRKGRRRCGSRLLLWWMLLAALCLTACGRDSIPDQGSLPGDPVVLADREWVYVPEVITVADEAADYERMQPVGNVFFYVPLQEEEQGGEKQICRYSLEEGNVTRVSLHWPEGGETWDVGKRFFAKDQSAYLTANVYPADYSSMKRFLCRFDPAGNCLFSRDITEQAGRDVSLRGLIADSQGRICLFLDNGEICLFTGEGEYQSSVRYGSEEDMTPAQINGFCEGADGRIYVCIGRESASFPGESSEEARLCCTLAQVDFENARLCEVADGLSDVRGICAAGYADESSAGESGIADAAYDLLLYDDTAVYGYRFDSQNTKPGSAGEALFAWMDCDVNGYSVSGLYPLKDGRLCAVVSDWTNDDRAIVALRRTRGEEAPERENLVLATVNADSGLASTAVKFNRGSSRYHLSVKAYGSLTELYTAILAKEPVDLIDLSGLNVRELAAKGFFEDLTPYLEQSERLLASDFVEGILDVYTFGDILTGIPREFSIQTVVGDASMLENSAGLTLDELLAAGSRYPGTETFEGMTREQMMQYLMMFNEDSFIDRAAGVCHFDSERFRKVLEYVGLFAEEPKDAAQGDEDTRLREGKVLFAVTELYPGAFRRYQKVFGEDTACIGFPTEDGRGGHILSGSGAFAIAAVSEHKESAWSFVEDSLTQERSELYESILIQYPTVKKRLDRSVDAAVERNELTREELQTVLELVPDATPLFSLENEEVVRIINEEAPAYYSGQKGLEDVSHTIQNRVQLYVNESSR